MLLVSEPCIIAYFLGQRLHEMILKPPVEIGDLLHLVSSPFLTSWPELWA